MARKKGIPEYYATTETVFEPLLLTAKSVCHCPLQIAYGMELERTCCKIYFGSKANLRKYFHWLPYLR